MVGGRQEKTTGLSLDLEVFFVFFLKLKTDVFTINTSSSEMGLQRGFYVVLTEIESIEARISNGHLACLSISLYI